MKRYLTVAAVVTLVAAADVALAAAGGEHGEPAITTGQWFTLAFTFVNFSIFVLLIVRFSRAPLRDFLTRRRSELAEALEAAAREKAEAEKARREYEQRVAGLEQARSEMIAELRAIAEADGERALATAREASVRLLAEAERTASSELERARGELRAETARLAAELASAEIRRRIGAKDKRRLVDEFVSGVPR